ncbi:MAG: hypothetical protein ABI076_05415, partial [Acidobacteriaceae bacterium]
MNEHPTGIKSSLTLSALDFVFPVAYKREKRGEMQPIEVLTDRVHRLGNSVDRWNGAYLIFVAL